MELETDAKRREYFEAHPEACSRRVAKGLCNRAAELARVDASQALRVVEGLQTLSELTSDEIISAYAERASGNHCYLIDRDIQKAILLLDSARVRFSASNDALEEAITASCLISALSIVGKDRLARLRLREARHIFEKLGDRLRLARLEHNYGATLMMADRWIEARRILERAYGDFMVAGEPSDHAVCLSNLAVCHTQLGDLALAVRFFERARTLSETAGLDPRTVVLDCNAAYVSHLLGDYNSALAMYRWARSHSPGDSVALASCDLGESKIFLDLCLFRDSGTLARRSLDSFEKLGLPRESAESLTVLGLCARSLGRTGTADSLLSKARSRFNKTGSRVWCLRIDLFRAELLFDRGELDECREAASRVLEASSTRNHRETAARCSLLLARTALRLGKTDEALRIAELVLRQVGLLDRALLEAEAHLVFGHALRSQHRDQEALRAYESSEQALQRLCDHVAPIALRGNFLENKLDVYESLFELHADFRRTQDAFRVVERAKSRALADLVLDNGRESWFSGAEPSLSTRVELLTKQLDGIAEQTDELIPDTTGPSPDRIAELRTRAGHAEWELQNTLRQIEAELYAGKKWSRAKVVNIDALRAILPTDSQVLEYYFAKNHIFCLSVTHESIQLVRLCTIDAARKAHRLFSFGMSRTNEGNSGCADSPPVAHLRRLYDLLFAPMAQHVRSNRLVIVPHGFLHQIPFHALHDGSRFLAEMFTFCAAPSATIFQMARTKPESEVSGSLVLGAPDETAPLIRDEVEAIGKLLPNSTVLVGTEASGDALERHAGNSRFVHIAAHASFRAENALFSSLRLGDGEFRVSDFYRQCWQAELVTLSGCATGLLSVQGGDEIVGLARGVFAAGTRSLLLSLWNVSDEATTSLMLRFYKALATGMTKDRALSIAMTEVRERCRHPFHWAPFVLLGDPRPCHQAT